MSSGASRVCTICNRVLSNEFRMIERSAEWQWVWISKNYEALNRVTHRFSVNQRRRGGGLEKSRRHWEREGEKPFHGLHIIRRIC